MREEDRPLLSTIIIDAHATCYYRYSSLPNVAIFATGGTIAGSSASELDTTSYTAGVIGVAALIEAVVSLERRHVRDILAYPYR